MPTAAVAQSVRPVAAAASARADAYMAFHSVRTLSSRPGRTRCRAGREQAPPPLLDELGTAEGVAHRPAEDGGPLEVARRGDVEPGAYRLGHGVGVRSRPRWPRHLVGGPHVELALDALGVGVLGRVDPALGSGEVAGDVGDDALDHLR